MIKFTQGSFTLSYKELLPKFEEHWEELGCPGGPDTLELNIAAYMELERQGTLKCFGIRDGDKLVGYACFNLYKHFHHKNNTFAIGDCFYVDPEYRKTLTGFQFLKYCERELKLQGAEYIQLVQNTNKDLDKFLNRLGYTMSDITYTKKV